VAREPDYWWTDSRGRRRPGYRARGGAVLIVAGLVALAGPGVGGTAVVGGSPGASVSAGSGSGAGTARSRAARERAVFDARRRLERRGLRVESRVEIADDCAAHSYGQVQQFFRARPCTALFRALLEVRDVRRNVVLVAIAWVEMPDEASARALHRLVDTGGTGNVTELSRERGRYRTVRFTGEHYASRRDATTVVNVQAQPVGRAAVGVAMADLVTDALG
jgi:hypothetical protein